MGSRIAAKSGWLLATIFVFTGALLLAAGRSALCACGRVALWAEHVQSPENSQQVADWYSFSHVIHGFLLYAAGWLVLRRWPWKARLVVAAVVEAGWELLENSPVIIDRYPAATAAVGYSGDSVLNSLSDIGCMIVGFTIARRLPWWATIVLAAGFELFTLWWIRDNLTLNVWMLLAPNDTLRQWQAAGQA